MIRLATAEGVVDLRDDRRTVHLEGRMVSALSGDWVVLDNDAVGTVDGVVAVRIPELSVWCVGGVDGGALVGTSEARLFRVDESGTVEPDESFDSIPTRDEWYTPWGAPPDVRSLAISGEGDALVNVHVGGLWRRAAGQDDWEQLVAVEADVHQVVTSPGRGSQIVAAAAAIGCGVSADGGITWRWSAEGLHASYSRAVAVAGDTVLVTASTGPSTREGAVYRRRLAADGPFERCTNGLPASFPYNLDTFSLAARGDEVALGTRDGRLFVSADAGANWKLAADDLPEIRAVAVLAE
jgi:hypothetical protein